MSKLGQRYVEAFFQMQQIEWEVGITPPLSVMCDHDDYMRRLTLFQDADRDDLRVVAGAAVFRVETDFGTVTYLDGGDFDDVPDEDELL